jgi:hypothetical protein
MLLFKKKLGKMMDSIGVSAAYQPVGNLLQRQTAT